MSMKLKNKVSAEQVRQMISGHSKHEVRDSGWYHQGMNDICNIGTYDSVVYVLRPNPLFYTRLENQRETISAVFLSAVSACRSCRSGRISWIPRLQLRLSFTQRRSNCLIAADRPLYTFLAMQNFLDWQHQDYPIFAKNKRAFEKQAAAEVQKADKEARMLIG